MGPLRLDETGCAWLTSFTGGAIWSAGQIARLPFSFPAPVCRETT